MDTIVIHPSNHPLTSIHHPFKHPFSSIQPSIVIHSSIHFQHKFFFAFSCLCFVWGAPFATPKLYFLFLLLFFLCFWGEGRERERERERERYLRRVQVFEGCCGQESPLSPFFCLSVCLSAAAASVIEPTNCSYKFII